MLRVIWWCAESRDLLTLGGDEEPLRQVAVRLEICSRGKRGKGEENQACWAILTNWYTGVSS